MQTEILDRHPALALKVCAVWFNMVRGDSRVAWDAALMPDPRVAHFWDARRLVGRWFAQNVGSPVCDGGIVWDTFYLYAPDGKWGHVRPISSGAPVAAHVLDLAASLMLPA